MAVPVAVGSAPLPPLVVRQREQIALRERLSSTLAGRGSLALIGGEAGIGKTALTEWLACAAADCSALVLVGRSYDPTETPPYGPWAEALAHFRAMPGNSGAMLATCLAPSRSWARGARQR